MNVKINTDSSEILSYDEIGIPLYIRKGALSFYPDYRALCHWHEDIEFIAVEKGCMEYYVNGKSVHIKKGDVIAINSGRLHFGYSDTETECCFNCIIFHPSMLTANRKIAEKYISAITKTCCRDYVLFEEKDNVTEMVNTLYEAKRSHKEGYELEVLGVLCLLWKKLYEKMTAEMGQTVSGTDMELLCQRKMVSYIYQNYENSITLADIAAAGSVCRSKCCRIFKKYVGQSPMEFVNAYRLECSQHLLLTTTLSITDVCIACGFNHLSYFARQFQAKYGYTPRDYRKIS